VLAGAFSDERVKMATLARALPKNEIDNPNVVKVVRSRKNDALYFSRSPIPMVRDGGRAEFLGHVGIYGYRRAFLYEFAELAPTPLERTRADIFRRAVRPSGVSASDLVSARIRPLKRSGDRLCRRDGSLGRGLLLLGLQH